MSLMERMKLATYAATNGYDPSDLFCNQTTDKKYKLMIKTHWETGMNYLCITKNADFRKYPGSGTGWRELLKEDKSPIITYLIFSTNSTEELSEAGKFYSELFDVVNSEDFANRIQETGYMSKTDCDLLRIQWAKIGAQALIESGNRGGCCSTKWQQENRDKMIENSAKGGHAGGKVVGSMFWWNNGSVNSKSFDCPGDGWVRGMLMSEKKKKQWEECRKKNGQNIKGDV